MINRITFSYNWNGKLDNDCFTTLRLHNPKKYVVGQVKEIWLLRGKDWVQLEDAIIIEVKTFPLEQVNEFIAHLDTGYNRAKTIQIIRRMYKLENPKMDFILLKKIKQKNGSTRKEPLIRQYSRR